MAETEAEAEAAAAAAEAEAEAEAGEGKLRPAVICPSVFSAWRIHGQPFLNTIVSYVQSWLHQGLLRLLLTTRSPPTSRRRVGAPAEGKRPGPPTHHAKPQKEPHPCRGHPLGWPQRAPRSPLQVGASQAKSRMGPSSNMRYGLPCILPAINTAGHKHGQSYTRPAIVWPNVVT